MNYVKELQLKDIIKEALREDIGQKDVTCESIIPKDKFVKAILLAKQDFIICGLNIAGLVFKVKDKNIKFKPLYKDGQKIKPGRVIARISGKAQSILTAERTALNFLCLLSGVATQTRKYVARVKPYKAKIMDTRKTIPGLRILEKYAVRIGGGYNHRMSLDEMVLVKDNHLKVIGGYLRLPKVAKGYLVELEVKNLREFKEAIKLNPDIIMLDNMNVKDMKKAANLSRRQGRKVLLEASGGINLKNVRKIASTGVDMISIGALTHSVKSVDISLEVL
jgi:nicotinate-nucleotide pyrophosphorylase (carboxylating)